MEDQISSLKTHVRVETSESPFTGLSWERSESSTSCIAHFPTEMSGIAGQLCVRVARPSPRRLTWVTSNSCETKAGWGALLPLTRWLTRCLDVFILFLLFPPLRKRKGTNKCSFSYPSVEVRKRSDSLKEKQVASEDSGKFLKNTS